MMFLQRFFRVIARITDKPPKQYAGAGRLFIGMAAMLILTGCMSYAGKTDADLGGARRAAPGISGKFYIASINYSGDGGANPLAGDCRNLGPLTMKSSAAAAMAIRELNEYCRNAYPTVFAAAGESAFPLAVQLNCQGGTQGDFSQIFCIFTAGLLPGAFPGESRCILKVTEAGDHVGRRVPVYFTVDSPQYFSALSPLGLIYWGETKQLTVPFKRCTIFDMTITRDLRDDFAAAVAAAIVREIARHNREYLQPPSVAPASGIPGGGVASGPVSSRRHDENSF